MRAACIATSKLTTCGRFYGTNCSFVSAGLRRAVVVVVFQLGGAGHEPHTHTPLLRREENTRALALWLSSLEAMSAGIGSGE